MAISRGLFEWSKGTGTTLADLFRQSHDDKRLQDHLLAKVTQSMVAFATGYNRTANVTELIMTTPNSSSERAKDVGQHPREASPHP